MAPPTNTIVIVGTQATELTKGDKTGAWAEELAAPYYTFKKADKTVVLASPKGGEIPLDPASLQGQFLTETADKFLKDDEAQKQLKNSKPLTTLSAQDFDAVFLGGGHGAVMDFKDNKVLADLLSAAYANGKVVSAVCHGPAGLLDPVGTDGKPLVNGKNVTGFSNAEEKEVGKEKVVPFLLEDELKKRGGKYTKGDNWQPHVVEDKNLVTGQNPQSSAGTAEGVIRALAKHNLA